MRRAPLLLPALLVARGLLAGSIGMTEEAALARAFPGQTPQRRVVELNPEEVTLLEKASRSKLPSPKVTLFEVLNGGEVQGRAYLDQHVVRTMPETLLTVVDADGKVRMVLLLQFQDHPDYVPRDKWLKTIEGKPLDDQLAAGRAVPRVTGSTMTVDAALAAVRRALALDALLRSRK
jgi:hypothetical protein